MEVMNVNAELPLQLSERTRAQEAELPDIPDLPEDLDSLDQAEWKDPSARTKRKCMVTLSA